MLKRLHLKNWRSLRDVEIEFSPITVFIGENSSGKTNILDALKFLQYVRNNGVVEAVYQWNGFSSIQTLQNESSQPIRFEIDYQPPKAPLLSYAFDFEFEGPHFISYSEVIDNNKGNVLEKYIGADKIDPGLLMRIQGRTRNLHDLQQAQALEEVKTLAGFIDTWQFLDEGFMPRLSSRNNPVNLYALDPHAANLPAALNYLSQINPQTYYQFQADLREVLSHVNNIETERTEMLTAIHLYESATGILAPTVSAGSARVMAMLAAFYLNSSFPGIPQLIAIEEPDIALNPGTLQRLIGQFRKYVESTDTHFQLILTTHNPTLLNYFEPEEVRIVSRDEQGYTHVEKVPEYIKELWLDEHGLGEVWLSNAFGGLSE